MSRVEIHSCDADKIILEQLSPTHADYYAIGRIIKNQT